MKKIILFLVLAICCSGMAYSQDNEMPRKDVLKVIKSRTSVRKFSKKYAEPKKFVTPLLQAAMAAPTAINKQPWEFMVITDEVMKNKIASDFKNASYIKQASFAIIVCGNMKETIDGPAREFWVQDCSAATENLLLAAHSLGLGAVWCGVYPDKERTVRLQEILALPEHIIPLNIIPIGFPEGEQQVKDKWKQEKIHWDKFGNNKMLDAPVKQAPKEGMQIKKQGMQIKVK